MIDREKQTAINNHRAYNTIENVAEQQRKRKSQTRFLYTLFIGDLVIFFITEFFAAQKKKTKNSKYCCSFFCINREKILLRFIFM